MINPKDAITIIAKRLKALIDSKELDASYDESDTTLSVYIDDIKLGRIPLLTLRLSDHNVNMHYFYHNRPTNPSETTNLSVEFYTPKTKNGKPIRNRVGHNVTVDNRSHATPFDITYFSYPSKKLVLSDIEPIYQQILKYVKGGKFIDPFLNTNKEAKTDTVHSRFVIRDPRNDVPQNISGDRICVPSSDTNYSTDYVSESNNNIDNQQDTNMKTENRNKNVVRLTESKLKAMVAESVQTILKEYYSDRYKFPDELYEWGKKFQNLGNELEKIISYDNRLNLTDEESIVVNSLIKQVNAVCDDLNDYGIADHFKR